MKKITVAFCGNGRLTLTEDLKKRLDNIVLDILQENRNSFVTFYCGGYGDFDKYSGTAIDRLREGFNCEKVYVSPYLNFDEKFLSQFYDDTIFPPLESVPPKFAILRRNKWIVDMADVLVVCVFYRYGGSGKMLEYAERRQRNSGLPKIIYVN